MAKYPVRSLLTLFVCVAGFLLGYPEIQSLAAYQQKDPAGHVDEQEVVLASLGLAVLNQQIVIAQIELELLHPTCQAAVQKVAEKEANLAAATIQFENTSRLQKKGITSEPEMRLQAARKDAASAQLEIAKAESDAAQKSVKLKEANITLLECQKKLAEAELQRLQSRVQRAG
jgi:multidrug resistance efflux pump